MYNTTSFCTTDKAGGNMSVKDEIRMYVMGCGFDGKSVSRGDLIKIGYSASDVIDALPAGSLPTDPKVVVSC
jgi:hypothetical protein